MRIITTIFVIFIILVGITFAGLNAENVSINYYFGSSKLPLSLLMAITLFIGCLIGIVTGFCGYVRQRGENRRLRARINLVEKEISNLRTIPIKDNH